MSWCDSTCEIKKHFFFLCLGTHSSPLASGWLYTLCTFHNLSGKLPPSTIFFHPEEYLLSRTKLEKLWLGYFIFEMFLSRSPGVGVRQWPIVFSHSYSSKHMGVVSRHPLVLRLKDPLGRGISVPHKEILFTCRTHCRFLYFKHVEPGMVAHLLSYHLGSRGR